MRAILGQCREMDNGNIHAQFSIDIVGTNLFLVDIYQTDDSLAQFVGTERFDKVFTIPSGSPDGKFVPIPQYLLFKRPRTELQQEFAWCVGTLRCVATVPICDQVRILVSAQMQATACRQMHVKESQVFCYSQGLRCVMYGMDHGKGVGTVLLSR